MSEAQKPKPHKLLWMLWFDKKSISNVVRYTRISTTYLLSDLSCGSPPRLLWGVTFYFFFFKVLRKLINVFESHGWLLLTYPLKLDSLSAPSLSRYLVYYRGSSYYTDDILRINFSEELLNEALRCPNHKTCFSFAT